MLDSMTVSIGKDGRFLIPKKVRKSLGMDSLKDPDICISLSNGLLCFETKEQYELTKKLIEKVRQFKSVRDKTSQSMIRFFGRLFICRMDNRGRVKIPTVFLQKHLSPGVVSLFLNHDHFRLSASTKLDRDEITDFLNPLCSRLLFACQVILNKEWSSFRLLFMNNSDHLLEEKLKYLFRVNRIDITRCSGQEREFIIGIYFPHAIQFLYICLDSEFNLLEVMNLLDFIGIVEAHKLGYTVLMVGQGLKGGRIKQLSFLKEDLGLLSRLHFRYLYLSMGQINTMVYWVLLLDDLKCEVESLITRMTSEGDSSYRNTLKSNRSGMVDMISFIRRTKPLVGEWYGDYIDRLKESAQTFRMVSKKEFLNTPDSGDHALSWDSGARSAQDIIGKVMLCDGVYA